MPAAARARVTAPPGGTGRAGKAPSAAQRALHKLGLVSDLDLALHLPLRHEDETRITRLADARDGETVQIEGVIRSSEVSLRGRRQLVAVLDDGSDQCTLRFFSFYPSMQNQLQVGARVRARGELRGGMLGGTMMHPQLRPADAPLAQALTPVYPSSASLPQAYLRRAVRTALARLKLPETVPAQALAELPGAVPATLRQALELLHEPPPGVALSTLLDRSHPAWQRLKAEELLAQQLSQHTARQMRARQRAWPLHAREHGLPGQLQAALPFPLTGAQQRVVHELSEDLARDVPMHRLLQGDVGSGKTVVAALAAAVAMDEGGQCALMAPTEILAEQHFERLAEWLRPLLAQRGRAIAWLTGSQKAAERRAALAAIEDGRAALVIGTHAVIQEGVRFAALRLAVIDEQHRFGVAQRLALRERHAQDGREPHLLMMSATPIPRTLAMSYYADLDVSTLDELPPGRQRIVTRLFAEHRRDELLARLALQLQQGRQAYWVCPLIEESEALDLRNATETQAELAAALPDVAVGLLHSRLPADEKKAVMAAFAAGRLAVLVATTVIEVGVDVPNASLMVVEHAERFGLSQLHQLRGRVGRGSVASVCVLLYSPGEGGRVGEAARERLRAMVDTQDGFEIARRDLEIRGPGEFLGARQSGDALLRFADLAEDGDLLEWARRWAPRMLAQSPELARDHIARWMGGKSNYLKA